MAYCGQKSRQLETATATSTTMSAADLRAQAMLDSGNLEVAEHLLTVAWAYQGSAKDCLDDIDPPKIG